jgi:ribulose-5-phosphate 4-epimerase/fuculose-1-phosphate aldolase
MLTSIGDIMRESHRLRWITTRDGNISIRRRDNFYITPSGGRKTIIHPEHILKATVSLMGELHWLKNPQTKPSGELEMHRKLQTTSDFGGCRAVVHLHPTAVIAAMEAGWDLREISKKLQELSRFTKVGPNVPALPVTSDVLAEETFWAMTDGRSIVYDIVGQKGHGVTAIGKSPWDAFEHVERLNHACEIMLLSGVKPK